MEGWRLFHRWVRTGGCGSTFRFTIPVRAMPQPSEEGLISSTYIPFYVIVLELIVYVSKLYVELQEGFVWTTKSVEHQEALVECWLGDPDEYVTNSSIRHSFFTISDSGNLYKALAIDYNNSVFYFSDPSSWAIVLKHVTAYDPGDYYYATYGIYSVPTSNKVRICKLRHVQYIWMISE